MSLGNNFFFGQCLFLKNYLRRVCPQPINLYFPSLLGWDAPILKDSKIEEITPIFQIEDANSASHPPVVQIEDIHFARVVLQGVSRDS